MKTIDLTERKIKEFIDTKRPPVEYRERLDLGYDYDNNVLTIFEIRPVWGSVDEKMNIPIAKAKFIKSRSIWKIYWMTSKMKWLEFESSLISEVKTIDDVIKIIDYDEDACFWG